MDLVMSCIIKFLPKESSFRLGKFIVEISMRISGLAL